MARNYSPGYADEDYSAATSTTLGGSSCWSSCTAEYPQGILQGFFSKFLIGGTQNFWFPSVPDAIFCCFRHEIYLFKVLLSLKVVKFDTKMYSNFSNFWELTSAKGDKPWSKNGDKCRMGGLTKFSPDGGTPQEKNHALITSSSHSGTVLHTPTLLIRGMRMPENDKWALYRH